MAQEDSEEFGIGDIFPEPPRPPSPEPTVEVYYRDPNIHNNRIHDWVSISIRLVGSHPLWGHHLWNAARSFATYLDANASTLCAGRTILELGAGGALPGIAATLLGAKKVVLTDYPDHDLLRNIAINVDENVPPRLRANVDVQGYIWAQLVALEDDGVPVSHLSSAPVITTGHIVDASLPRFDLILMSDLIFNHSQHDALLNTCEQALSFERSNQDTVLPSTPAVLVFFSHHRPNLAHRDLNFFTKARDRGWTCEEFFSQNMGAMFPDDPGDLAVRSVVHGWRLYRTPPVHAS
ncbi:hypothetical protein BS47DRAFT_1466587 [Hydnum rufescens UP504]|uniref:Protein N-terminal and lysine N-methyltransferase EFM7 n=1 Tax=Hydnum rufescens UP504 TaxID=1448309 RepID=A0A9P6AUV1_9AGAM|nr:hypothetical protein BS47DRAFT_1466587 [Hydnum rufescens UP504]